MFWDDQIRIIQDSTCVLMGDLDDEKRREYAMAREQILGVLKERKSQAAETALVYLGVL